MTGRLLRRAVTIGLGVLAGAVLPSAAQAQVPVRRDTLPTRPDTGKARRDTLPTRVDTARAGRVAPPAGQPIVIPLPAGADSMIRNDSLAQGITGQRPQPRADSIAAPLARAEAPPVLEIGASRIYDRAAIFATGALTLSDLLGRVPGLTSLATGWLVAPTAVAHHGDLRRVRVFVDGLELDPMDQREQGRAAVNDLPLHMVEELRIERGADEVRVYARAWRVTSLTPYTRADVLTGDQNSNLYRGYFGRRYGRGEALQVSAEQLNTQPVGSLPSADGRSYFLRTGIARPGWSIDLTGQRVEVTREEWAGRGDRTVATDTIAPLITRRSTGYLRLALGEPEGSRWFQAVASAHGFKGTPESAAGDTLVTNDSTSFSTQYLLTGGVRRGPLRVSAAERIRRSTLGTSATPSVRASLETTPLAISAFAEGVSELAPSRLEATVRLAPLRRVTFLAAGSRTGGGTFERVFGARGTDRVIRADGTLSDAAPLPVVDSSASRYELPASTHLRAEAGVRVRDLWISGGVVRRGSSTLLSAAGLGDDYMAARAVRPEGSATAQTLALRGRVYRAVNVDAWAIAWNDTAGLYRPRYQSRAELFIQTNLLDRFPNGNFGLLTSLAHEYRSNTRYATGDTVRTALGYRTLDFKLEIRIQTAVVSYQFRNLLQEQYAQVPGFLMPRQTQFYGVRWDFWN